MAKGVSQTTVAAHAGVSAMTVSRVLSTPELVDPETRDRVLAAVAETGYVARKQTRMVAVLISSITNDTFATTVQGVNEALIDQGYDIVLGDIGYSQSQQNRVVQAMLGRRPDGVIISSSRFSTKTAGLLKAARIPVVQIWDDPEKPVDCVVGYSNRRAGELAAEHFIKAGRRRLAYLGNSFFHRDTQRWNGFASVCEKARLPAPVFVEALSTKEGRHSYSAGEDYFSAFDGVRRAPNAVFCSSDVVAAGVVFTGLRRGLRFPDDLAVCGFGDVAFAGAMEPMLTTVRVPAQEMGRRAGQILLARVQEQSVVQKRVLLDVSLISRKTG